MQCKEIWADGGKERHEGRILSEETTDLCGRGRDKDAEIKGHISRILCLGIEYMIKTGIVGGNRYGTTIDMPQKTRQEL